MHCSALDGTAIRHGFYFPRSTGRVEDRDVLAEARRRFGAVEVRAVEQVHGTEVLPWPEVRPDGLSRADAVCLTGPDQWASIRTADCVPVVLATGAAVAVVHAGWRGSAGGIVHLALEKLLSISGAGPKDVICVIGPHIRACCYEVSADVAARFDDAWGSSVWQPGVRGRPHLDLAAVQVAQLAAIAPGRIHVSPECTRCGSLGLPSYRRDGDEAARLHAIVGVSSRLVSGGPAA